MMTNSCKKIASNENSDFLYDINAIKLMENAHFHSPISLMKYPLSLCQRASPNTGPHFNPSNPSGSGCQQSNPFYSKHSIERITVSLLSGGRTNESQKLIKKRYKQQTKRETMKEEVDALCFNVLRRSAHRRRK